MSRQSAVIVFGMGPAGLFLSRQLKKMNMRIYGIGKSDDIGRYSNTLTKYYTAESKNLVEKAISGILNETGNKPVGYICSDQYLTLFIEEYPIIFNLIDFIEPQEHLLRLIAAKDDLIQYCKTLGMKFPDEYDVTDLEHLPYPIAIKPNLKHGTSPIKKINFINNKQELLDILSYSESKELHKEDLLLQKVIAGNNQFEYGYGGYFKNGEPVNVIYFIQARQYPQGVSCYTIELTDRNIIDEIGRQTDLFIHATNYSGFLQFDLKKDSLTGEMYVLDINPRPWGSIGMLKSKCVESVFLPVTLSKKKICWRFPLKEIMSIKNKKNLSYKKCRGLKKEGEYVTTIDLFDKSDLRPFFMQPIVMILKLFKMSRY